MNTHRFVIYGTTKSSDDIQYLCSDIGSGYFWGNFSNAVLFKSKDDALKECQSILDEAPSPNGLAPYLLRQLAGLYLYKSKEVVNIKVAEIQFHQIVEHTIKVEDKR